MPKNKGKGGKNRRRGKNENEQTKRELELKDDEQEYAQVTKILGNGRLSVYCFDGETRIANIRGKMRKKVWINNNDIVLVGLRDFQKDKCDVINKYHPDEARRLKRQGHIPESINIDDGGVKEEDNMITFGNENDDDRDMENPEDPDAIPEQPDRYAEFDLAMNVNLKQGLGSKKFVMNESASESEEESDEESDDDEEEDFANYNNYSSSKNKKDIDIDAI